MTDPFVVERATQLSQRTEADLARQNLRAEESTDQICEAPAPPQENILQTKLLPPAKAAHAFSTPSKEKKTSHELAAMILADLSEIEGCPKRGVKVAVYGYNPWNAWLSFGTDAGPLRNKGDLDGFFDIITERLKRLYDVAM